MKIRNSKEKSTGRKWKTTKKVTLIMVVTIVVAVLIFGVLCYINDYYRATDKAQRAMSGNEQVGVEEQQEYYHFFPIFLQEQAESGENTGIDDEKLPGYGAGIIFYPGAKVEETAYAPLLVELAEYGYEVYLVKMPAKLAIFGINKADAIIEKETHIKNWIMMGHSLGGAMAASYSADHDEEIDGLVLLAAYSTEDLSDKDMDVYSFYGSEDKVLNMEKYEEYHGNLPDDAVEEVIDGGNHAYYGYYGEQDGDGTAAISREEQIECVIDFMHAK